jgi:hypothetical protein
MGNKYRSDQVDEGIWRCECGGGHFLGVSLWKWDDEPYDGYIQISSWLNIKERVKAAWFAIWGRKHTWAMVLLSPKTCQEFIDALTTVKEQLEEHGHKTE